MKFSQIPKLTSVGSYQTNMPLKYAVEWINEKTEELDLQLNPDFQRGHIWTEEQQIKFVEYLIKGGQSARVIYFNHPGWMKSFKGEFVCVDGLQRLTAVMRFMNNEIKVFGSYLNDFEDKLPRDIDLLFNVNNLKTRKEVLQWYIEFNSAGTPHTDEEINRVKMLLENE